MVWFYNMDIRHILMHSSLLCFPTCFSSWICHRLFHPVVFTVVTGHHTYISNLTLCVRAHVQTQFSDAALLGLMIMCVMSVPCCGCVSQAERLTNCSILLNVRVMEAINGSELIAVTHLAPCYCVLRFSTRPEDLVLSRCLILDWLFGLWTDEQPLNRRKWQWHSLLHCP